MFKVILGLSELNAPIMYIFNCAGIRPTVTRNRKRGATYKDFPVPY